MLSILQNELVLNCGRGAIYDETSPVKNLAEYLRIVNGHFGDAHDPFYLFHAEVGNADGAREAEVVDALETLSGIRDTLKWYLCK